MDCCRLAMIRRPASRLYLFSIPSARFWSIALVILVANCLTESQAYAQGRCLGLQCNCAQGTPILIMPGDSIPVPPTPEYYPSFQTECTRQCSTLAVNTTVHDDFSAQGIG